ncbi:endolytic transglycosylase MltG [Thermophilibacter sp. ET337]|uniref:endolytic transglycosylase MltG n=1 Tax=Thermophilibacter sp. ET337 TaxID=2973084 RepID=UPI0021AC88F2|nr:endolytic transglycosylase MltG [Thermophilibacter sp. ET337]MCR8907657.1 endolytic transglycosylase MltG [Thermophilibacter sp. ET337]
MATTDGRTPSTRGSHFSTDGATERRDTAPSHAEHAQPAEAPAALGTVSAPRSALSGSRVSSRTAAATRRAGSRRVQRDETARRQSRAPFFALAFVAVAVVVGFVLVVIPALTGSTGEGETQEVVAGNTVTITVPEGSGAAAVADALFDAGAIANKSEFLSEVRRTNAEASLKSGTYEIVTGTDQSDIIAMLTTGPVMAVSFTIPEGYTLAQIAAVVEQEANIPSSDFLAQAKASAYVDDYPFLADVTDDSLEGYLFPKTYGFPTSDVTADDVIRAMLDQFQTEVASIDFSAAIASIQERYGITVNEDDIITMASIIEREAATDEQRADIASVFYNRLEIGMMLQSDATLVYSLGRDVTADDLKVDDPYNTYTREGLTPTPICSPGLPSIQAAANPSETSYLYFYITPDTATFSETYDEHTQSW